LTIEEQEGAGLLQRGDGLFGHLRAVLGGVPPAVFGTPD
jgi:hypothetical protein